MEEIQQAGGKVVAVSAEPIDETREALESIGFSFPLVSDPDLAAIDAYGVRHPSASISGGDIARPAAFVIDRTGQIVWRDLTENWRIRLNPQRVIDQLVAIP